MPPQVLTQRRKAAKIRKEIKKLINSVIKPQYYQQFPLERKDPFLSDSLCESLRLCVKIGGATSTFPVSLRCVKGQCFLFNSGYAINALVREKVKSRAFPLYLFWSLYVEAF